jgi:hypothetical protein
MCERLILIVAHEVAAKKQAHQVLASLQVCKWGMSCEGVNALTV